MGSDEADRDDRADAAQLLGVAVDAPAAVIQRAFRAAVKEAHPDGGGTDGEAFGRLHAARELLLNPTTRSAAGPETRATESPPTRNVKPSQQAGDRPQGAQSNAEQATTGGNNSVFDQPAESRGSSLFTRGVLLVAAGLGLLIGLLVAATVVASNETQAVRIAPVAEVPAECIVVTAGTISGASCDEPGALSVASQTTSSAACATGTTRLEIPNGDTFCLRPEVQD